MKNDHGLEIGSKIKLATSKKRAVIKHQPHRCSLSQREDNRTACVLIMVDLE